MAAAAVFDLAKTHQFLAANDKTNLTPMANNNKITVRRRSRPREPVDLPDSRACPDLQSSNCAAHRKDKLARCLIQIVSSPLASQGTIFISAPRDFPQAAKRALCLNVSRNFIFKLRQNIEPRCNTFGYCVRCPLMFAND